MSRGLLDWISAVDEPGWIWYAKYLAANDTLVTGGHQAGPYVPRLVFGTLFSSVLSSNELNPSHHFEATIADEGVIRTPRAIWYNNKVIGTGTRNECRITGWGGAGSPLLDPDATGALCIFAFRRGASGDAAECRIWICRNPAEEETAISVLGTVEPGAGVMLARDGSQLLDPAVKADQGHCQFRPEMLPATWRNTFPAASDIVALAIQSSPSARQQSPDRRLLTRRDCEYRIFRYVEESHVLPLVGEGFRSVDAFVATANAVSNRRKARSGASLELQTKAVFQEEHLQFSHDAVSERNKRPDFTFPSQECYQNPRWPEGRLRILGVKTTCKDRWRQVLDEAERVRTKHLLTLQEGVSESQFRQMRAAGLQLVVPQSLQRKYPREVRGGLVSLQTFIEQTREACNITGA